MSDVHRLGVICLLLAAVGMAAAQHTQVDTEKANAPKPPFVAQVPENSGWVIAVSNHGDLLRSAKVREAAREQPKRDPAQIEKEVEVQWPEPGITQRQVRRISNSYSRGARQEVIETRGGERFENFIAGGRLFFDDPKTGKPAMADALTEDFLENPSFAGRMGEFNAGFSISAGSFGEFSWIARRNYVGMANYKGRKCHVYRLNEHDVASAFFAAENQNLDENGNSILRRNPDSLPQEKLLAMKKRPVRTAFIDAETNLPVALENEYTLREYTFHKLEKPVQLPQKFYEMARKQEAEVTKYYQGFRSPE